MLKRPKDDKWEEELELLEAMAAYEEYLREGQKDIVNQNIKKELENDPRENET